MLFSLTGFLKPLKCRLLLAADTQLSKQRRLFSVWEDTCVPAETHFHESSRQCFHCSLPVNEDIRIFEQKSIFLFSCLPTAHKMSGLGKQLAVMSQGSVITRPAGCSFLHLGQPCSSFVFIYVFVTFPSCGKCSKSSFVFLFFFLKREEKQGSENGCNVGPFIMVSKMHSKEPLLLLWHISVYYALFPYRSHLRSWETRSDAKTTHPSSWVGHGFFHESLEKLIPD